MKALIYLIERCLLHRRNALLFSITAVLGANVCFQVASRAADVYVEPLLRSQLAALGSSDPIQVVLNFDPSVTSGIQLAAAIHVLGAGTVTFKHLNSVGVLASGALIDRISQLAGLTGMYANRQLKFLMPQPNAFIGADAVWNTLGVTGAGVGVAVLDSGIDGTHRDLAYGSKTVQNVKILLSQDDVFSPSLLPASRLMVEGLDNTDTSSGHGSHVAGIVAGSGAASNFTYQGVAKGATLLGISTGDTLLILWALAGFDYLLDHAGQYNIKAVNNSWSSEGGAQAWDPNDPINQATKKVHDSGITVVFAAGNSGPSPDTMNPYAEAPWVIAVAAGSYPGDSPPPAKGLLADFSSRGLPGSDQFHPTLTAPGTHIVSTRASTGATLNVLDAPSDLSLLQPASTETFTHYTIASGTSMAAPHVAGVVALMQEAAGGTLTPDEVKEVLVLTARPMTRPDGSPYAVWEVGAGYVDAFAAVQAVTPLPALAQP